MQSENKAKILLKNTALYTISSFGSKIFSFLIVPLYTYYLSTKEFGTYDTIYSMVALIAPMCVLAIHEGLLRWLLKSDEDDKIVANTGMTLYILFITVFDFICIIIFRFVHWPYATLFIACLTSNTLIDVMQFTSRGLKKNMIFAISGMIQTFVMLGLNVLLVVFFRKGISGMLISYCLSQFSAAGYIIICIRKLISFKNYRFDINLAKSMLIYSIMLVPNNISWWIMNSSSRLMLTALVGSAFTGVYSIACKFPSIVTMIHTIFYRAWQEQAVLEYDSKSRDQYYSQVFNMYMRFAFCIILVLIPMSKLYIVYTMSTEFKKAYMYMGILMVASLFNAFSSFYGTGYISAKDTKNVTLTTAAGAVVSIVLNVALIGLIKIWAVCISTLVGYAVTMVLRIIQTRKYFKIIVKWYEFFGLLAVSLLFSILVCLKDNITAWIMLVIAVILTFVINKDVMVIIIRKFKDKVNKSNGKN